MSVSLLQEVSGTIERTNEQLSEIQQQVATLEDTQPVFIKIRVFCSRVPLPPPESPVVEEISSSEGPAAVSSSESADPAAAEAATASGPSPQENGTATSPPSDDQQGGKGSAKDTASSGEEPEKEEPEIEYEVVETTSVEFTVDRYTEKMGDEVEALQAQVEDLTQRRDAVLEGFKEMVAHFGERPQAVKESEWWADFLKFLKPFKKLQDAIVKKRAAEEEAAERKRRKEQAGGTTHRQRA